MCVREKLRGSSHDRGDRLMIVLQNRKISAWVTIGLQVKIPIGLEGGREVKVLYVKGSRLSNIFDLK